MKVSIITPSFNSQATIERTIRSVLAQSYDDLEYIIIDGDSTDGTMEIVKKYASSIECIISEKDKGISDAYNKGIQKATGELIGIVAADDELLVDAIQRLVDKYDGVSDVVSGGIIIEADMGCYIGKSNPDLSQLRYGTSLCHPATYIRKEAYEKYGLYDLSYKCAIDRELLLRYYINGATFQVIDDVLSFFHTGGISTFNPCKTAYREDKKISIKYGLNPFKASIIQSKANSEFYIKLILKKVLKFFGLKKFKKKVGEREYLSEDLVEVMRADLNEKKDK